MERRIEYAKNSVLGAIFTTALEDGVIAAHPSHRVPTDPMPRKPRRILTAPQFDALSAALPDSDAQLLVETAIETGLRWGELTELRAADIDVANRLLTVSRAVIAVSPEAPSRRAPVLGEELPKDKEYRQLRMSDQIVRKLSVHMAAHELGPRCPPTRALSAGPNPARPGEVLARHHHRLRAGPVPV